MSEKCAEAMFVIKRLWIDTLENRNAYGFEDIGVVATKEEADRICSLENVPKAKYPWPLNYAIGFNGDSVPRFVAKELRDISGLTLDQLKAL